VRWPYRPKTPRLLPKMLTDSPDRALLVGHREDMETGAPAAKSDPPGCAGARHTMRTLPIRVNPVAEESLDSWLEALASRTSSTWGEILQATGFFDARGNTASYWAARAIVSLTAEQLDVVSHCTGVRPRRLREMTLQPWIKDTSSQRRSVASLRVTGSRFCPVCLRERGGRWRVWWRLRWAFACPAHACLLADTCSVCGGLQRTAPPRFRDVPNLGSCSRVIPQSGQLRRCGGSLSSVRVLCLDNDLAIEVQRELLCVLHAGRVSGGIYASTPVPSAMFARDLRVLGQWMLRHGRAHDVAARISDQLWQQYALRAANDVFRPLITNHGARMTSSSPAADAAIACMAAPILQSADIESAAKSLQWVTSSMCRRGLSPSKRCNYWPGTTSPALDALRRTVQCANDRVGRTRPSP